MILNPDEAALLGSIEPLVFDVDRVMRRLADKRIRSALARIGFTSSDSASLATRLLALAVVHGPVLRQLLGEGPIITDDHPLIHAARSLIRKQINGWLQKNQSPPPDSFPQSARVWH